ncbi:hypothetical protein HIM_03204 [Hirsutella minnesotensis 3608]|nr:hypothetical protein HIM_03204 [Hirsutella minnesotensis 3608]
MRDGASMLLLAGLAFVRTASAGAAIPAVTPTATLAARDRGAADTAASTVDSLAPWVTLWPMSQSLSAKTMTPSVTTTAGGNTSIVDAAPYELTGSVFSWRSWGVVGTSTGLPPNPTAANQATGEGFFSRCVNRDGAFAPFCRPLLNSTLIVGNTYYITWDPDYFNQTKFSSNSTHEVAVRLDRLDHERNKWIELNTFDRVPAQDGYWPFKLGKEHLIGPEPHNVTISLVSSQDGSDQQNRTDAVPVVLERPDAHRKAATPAPKKEAILIGLPIALCGFALILVGLFVWHRKTRRIELGNIMSRTRRGYTGRRQRRMFRSASKDQGIQLDTSPVSPPPVDYRDEPPRPRRDSDGLGSLVNSPVSPNFNASRSGRGNAFRDEVDRQERERKDERC